MFLKKNCLTSQWLQHTCTYASLIKKIIPKWFKILAFKFEKIKKKTQH